MLTHDSQVMLSNQSQCVHTLPKNILYYCDHMRPKCDILLCVLDLFNFLGYLHSTTSCKTTKKLKENGNDIKKE